jgi:quercetin dioxygenase-like cupin family protein
MADLASTKETKKMKFLTLATILSLVSVLAMPVAAATGVTIVTPSDLQWQSNGQLPAGAKMAVLAGDPNSSGWYTIRISLPAGGAFPPHFHGGTEYVTVLSGTVEFGTGDSLSAGGTMLTSGAYVEIPPGIHHFAMAKTAAVVQVSGMGPMTTTFVK